MYGIYKQARNAAWQFLIDNNITSLPVNLLEVCNNNNIRLLRDTRSVYLSDADRGIAYYRDDQFRIIVNGIDSVLDQRYTIGHELGHIFLHHPMTDGKYGRSFGVLRKPNSKLEYQAERFSIDILAPACALWGLNLHKAEEIAEVCGISIQAATYRAERMKILYKRNAFLIDPLEQQVYDQFSNFIRSKKFPAQRQEKRKEVI